MRIAVVEKGALIEAEGAKRSVPWWSFSKTVLAAAALALVRDGRLVLDAPVAGCAYSLRHLLQHRSGLGDYGGLASYHQAVERGDEPWPVALMLARAEADRLRYEPGRGWAYSNIGYFKVGELIQHAAGLPLADAVAVLVTRPLGVPLARLALAPEDLAGADLGAIRRYHPGWVYHGLLVGSLPDAALLLDRLMMGGFLPRALLDEMRTPCRLGGIVPGRPWRSPGYGLGLMCGGTRFGWRVEGHTGGGPGSVCAIYHCPEGMRTAAAFIPGRQGRVESAAFRRARGA